MIVDALAIDDCLNAELAHRGRAVAEIEIRLDELSEVTGHPLNVPKSVEQRLRLCS